MTQALCVVASHAELDGRKEARDPLLALVGEVLPYALFDEVDAALELDDGQGDAVHVDDEVEPLLRVLDDGDLLGDGKVVIPGVVPVDEIDGDGCCARLRLDGNAIFQHFVDALVGSANLAGLEVPQFLGELVERFCRKIGALRVGFAEPEIQVVDAHVLVIQRFKVAEVFVAQLVVEQAQQSILGRYLRLPDGVVGIPVPA